MSDIQALMALLAQAKDEHRSPEVLHSIMRALEAALRAQGRDAYTIYLQMLGLRSLFQGRGADHAWAEHRATFSVWRQLWVGSQTPKAFRVRWSVLEQIEGDLMVRKALEAVA